MATDPYRYFRIEARELLAGMGQGVLDLEKGAPATEIVARLLRQAHTLKGAARVVKQREIADTAHAIEDVLSPFRTETSVPRDRADSLLRLLDSITARVAALDSPPEATSASAPDAVGPSPARAPGGDEAPRARVSAESGELDALVDGITETYVQVTSLDRTVGTVARVRHLVELMAEQLNAPRAQRAPDTLTPRFRTLVDELRGLVAGVERNLAVGVDQVGRELRQVREAAERLRLAPAGSMFMALERTARDVAQSQGKRAVFAGRGGDIRLDAAVLAVVQNALVQAVRNAIAHGIEPDSERRAAGKSPLGQVHVEVSRRRNRVVFRCRDDGRGVDLEAVRRALERQAGGALSAEAGALDAAGLLRLLLKGGISTAGAITELSGRGIGLDVIRQAAEQLGGDVSVQTEAGRGTTLELVVPLSLSMMEALVVEADDRIAAIPLHAVRRTVRLTPADVAHSAQGASIIDEGTVIPFAPLGRALGATAQAAGARAWSAVVVESGNARAAIGVDRLLGTEEIVMRPLPALAAADPVVAGATLDAAGRPRMVLDPERLVAQARDTRFPETKARTAAPILVIDDSMTTRMLEQSILESAGYEVEVAASAEEGFDKALARRFSLFLVDVEMPGMDGVEFVQRSRADAALRQVPAILVTSRDAPEDRQRGVDAGAAAYIVKSEFDQADLLQRIRTLVQ